MGEVCRDPRGLRGSEDPRDLIEMGSSVCGLKNRDLFETLVKKEVILYYLRGVFVQSWF